MNALVQLSYNQSVCKIVKSCGLSPMARTLYQGLRGRKPVTILLGALSADFTADTVGVRRSVEIVDCLERQVANAFLSRIESRDVLYDIGAECGVYGILAAKRCQKVVCFEPFPDSYSNVLGNIATLMF